MVLHEEPMLFSQHRMIPGTIIETAGYEALNEAQRQAMGEGAGRLLCGAARDPGGRGDRRGGRAEARMAGGR